ncbi:MAG: hypothetical protein P8L79_13450 [Rhodospirillaceae bacterium]|nr:hypothetical protein [Rhodospirillaceae bacterium]
MPAAMREEGFIAEQEEKSGQLLGPGALNYAERGRTKVTSSASSRDNVLICLRAV